MKDPVETFRSDLRKFERAIDTLNRHCCFQDITLAQCHTLMEIGNEEGLTLNQLSDRLDLDKSTMSRTIDNLVKSKWVLRKISLEDRRCVNLYLTRTGQGLFEKINQVNNAFFRDVFDKLSPEQLKHFLDGFHKVALTMSNSDCRQTVCI